jgi:hypothetical protein
MQLMSLPAKFNDQVINGSQEPELKRLDQALANLFSQALQPTDLLSEEKGFIILDGKPHVVTHPLLPGWIIKGKRADRASAEDQHIYRLRRAKRLQAVIDKRGFTEFVVPRKFLYQTHGQWFVLAEKLELQSDQLEPKAKLFASTKPLLLTEKQAREAATLIFEGKLEDPHNLKLTKQGKIALFDTEPIGRLQTKIIKQTMIGKWLPIIKCLNFRKGIINSYRLNCEDIAARNEIKKIQTRFLILESARLVARFAIPLFLTGSLIVARTIASQSAFQTAIKVAGISLTLLSGLNAIAHLGLMTSMLFTYVYYRTEYGQLALMWNDQENAM